ncbi:hypothetical protein ACFLTI_00430 [Bacteroidota bacterium]
MFKRINKILINYIQNFSFILLTKLLNKSFKYIYRYLLRFTKSIKLRPFLKALGKIELYRNGFYNAKHFILNIQIPKPEYIWKRIQKFFLVNKVGILGTMAIHMILVLIFLLIQIRIMQKVPETGLLFEFVTEEIDFPIEENDKQNKDEENRRNIAVNQYEIDNDQIIDYSYNYNYNEEEIERIAEENVQKVIDENPLTQPPELSDFADLSIIQDEVKQNETDSSKTYKGPTNIYYNLENRQLTYLAIPVYKCEGGGKITVEIKVNKRGHVINARVISGDAIKNQCLVIAAQDAASRTTFNQDAYALNRQTGTITYNFIAQ